MILSVHLAMNGKVGASIGNPRVATGWQPNALSGVKEVNPVLLTAGLKGACLVLAIAWLIPQVGASFVMIALIAGRCWAGWCFRTSAGSGLRNSRYRRRT